MSQMPSERIHIGDTFAYIRTRSTTHMYEFEREKKTHISAPTSLCAQNAAVFYRSNSLDMIFNLFHFRALFFPIRFSRWVVVGCCYCCCVVSFVRAGVLPRANVFHYMCFQYLFVL